MILEMECGKILKAIKFDEEKVRRCIDAYHDQYDEYPYVIINEKTYKILPPEKPLEGMLYLDYSKMTINATTEEHKDQIIQKNGCDYILKEDAYKPRRTWYGCKVMIDNTLEFGEVHIG